jgi:hypothetical protein
MLSKKIGHFSTLYRSQKSNSLSSQFFSFTFDTFEQIANAICEVFPTLTPDIFFSKPEATTSKLYNKLSKLRYKMRNSNLMGRRRYKRKIQDTGIENGNDSKHGSVVNRAEIAAEEYYGNGGMMDGHFAEQNNGVDGTGGGPSFDYYSNVKVERESDYVE